ncbi:SGNH hydrolase domain-containing protein [Lysobacter terrae]
MRSKPERFKPEQHKPERFKPEVEGLRGVAVAAVVLAHAAVPGLSGGFIGVDVFFVISGYLITALLTRELATTGRVDYWHFYARRTRRLLPAFLLMLVATLCVAAAFLPANRWSLQATSGAFSSLWASNIYFAFKQFDYFADGAGGSLYLHTWSLGVEEQFYLLWPVLLAFSWKRLAAASTERIFLLLGGLTVLGYALALMAYTRQPIAAYYLMPTRLWELSLGGFLAVMPARFAPSLRLRAPLLGAVGLALIVLGVVVINEQAGHLFLWLLIPVSGAGLVLMASNTGLARFPALDNAPLRFLGRISYSLYLWHWPLLVLARVLFDDLPYARVAAVVAALALARASTLGLEEPIRNARSGTPRGQVLGGLCASLLTVFAFQHWPTPAQPQAALANVQPKGFIERQISMPSLYQSGCDDWYQSASLKPCTLVSDAASGTRVLLVGDSVGAQWFPALEAISLRRHWNLTVLTKSSCPLADVKFYYARIGREFTECEEWRDHVADFINRTRPDLLLIGSSAANPLKPEQWLSGTRSFLGRVHTATPDVVLLGPTPILPFNGLDCLLTKNRSQTPPIDGTGCEVPLKDVAPRAVSDALKQAAGMYSNVRVLDLNPIICADGRCSSWRDGRLVYRDGQHLNAAFVASLDRELESRLTAPAAGARVKSAQQP